MSKHIGIVACSAEGAALCYRTICSEAPQKMGEHNHPEISMHTFPLGDYMVHIKTGDWKKVADLMLSSTKKVAGMGADFAICPDNTIHEAFDFVIRKSPIPWLHIAEEVAKKATDTGYKKIAITGTKYLMEGPVYPETLKKFDIDFEIPDKGSREKIDTIIFKELVNGIFSEKSRRYFNEVIDKLKQAGCDAVVLGCTEIPLLVKPDDCPLPTLDSTRLLARAALREAVG
ncbi:amino acid racemase [candidate division KSB1 bacterium]|nr:amino acid racemase [candidate division KSB1 bacterium]